MSDREAFALRSRPPVQVATGGSPTAAMTLPTLPDPAPTRPATDDMWQSFARELRRYFERRVRDRSAVDDLLQECFLRVHERLDQLEDPSRAGAWVSSIARNLLLDTYRRRPATADEPVDEIGHDIELFDPVERQLGQWISAQLAALPEHEARAVELADLQGIKQSVAAKQLGLSHSGFKSRVQRGRAKLRAALDACCEVELGPTGRVLDYRRRSASGAHCRPSSSEGEDQAPCCIDDKSGPSDRHHDR